MIVGVVIVIVIVYYCWCCHWQCCTIVGTSLLPCEDLGKNSSDCSQWQVRLLMFYDCNNDYDSDYNNNNNHDNDYTKNNDYYNDYSHFYHFLLCVLILCSACFVDDIIVGAVVVSIFRCCLCGDFCLPLLLL